MNKLLDSNEWRALNDHLKDFQNQRLEDFFVGENQRFKDFSLNLTLSTQLPSDATNTYLAGAQHVNRNVTASKAHKAPDLTFDYSKNFVTQKTIELLTNLATARHLKSKINALFDGEAINFTEKRPALHSALRDPYQQKFPEIHHVLNKMRHFCEQVRNQRWLGATGKPIRDIVNVGIGGSHLGPLMTTHALNAYAHKDLRCHFISNVDPVHVKEVLEKINPETSLFIISSKSFNTIETLTNAHSIKKWFGNQPIEQHFVAVTAKAVKAVEFGIKAENIFEIWDWVGGRYSIWSAIGLPLAMMIGMDKFLEFLEGGYQVDQHFKTAEFNTNIPVLMALLGIWYNNFFDAQHHLILPYYHSLYFLPDYFQQADMESNGKRVTSNGELVNYSTGPIIWGEQGCNAQHSFYQLLHQSNYLIPIDFILVAKETTNVELSNHHDIQFASALSQAQALMRGKSYEAVMAELLQAGYSQTEAASLAPHKVIEGNKPSNILLLKMLTPKTLGALIALYEHKIYVQSVIWDINAFDQWGVELGKQLLPFILNELTSTGSSFNKMDYDASTHHFIQEYKRMKAE